MSIRAATAALVAGGALCSALCSAAVAQPANTPPVVTLERPSAALFAVGRPVALRLVVSDADGDRVTARLVRSPDLQGFRPIEAEPSGAVRDLWWRPGPDEGGRLELLVEAWDARAPTVRRRFAFPFEVAGSHETRALDLCDVDGDGSFELLGAARLADLGALQPDVGALALFAADRPASWRGPGGGANWRTALLRARAPAAGDLLGGNRDARGKRLATTQNVQWGDFDGDGRREVVARSDRGGGTLHLFRAVAGGAPQVAFAELGSGDPDDGIGGAGGRATVVADLTGDGIDDLVAIAPTFDGARPAQGAVLLFAGGPALVGTPPPSATLLIPSARAGDRLGDAAGEAPLAIGDVTGDGRPDLVVQAPWCDRGMSSDVGRLLLFAGGSGLVGTPSPVAELDAAANGAGAKLSLRALVDLDGDGAQDIVAASGAGSSGSLFVWYGGFGAGAIGTRDADARLVLKAAQNGTLGASGFVDLDRDGRLDVVALVPDGDWPGAVDGGFVAYWLNGALQGLARPSGLLHRATPRPFDLLGGAADQLAFVDVTGDGADDVVLLSASVDGSAVDSGSIDVWHARAGVSGNLVASASLEVAGAAAGEPLERFLALDVTGDGIRDVVATAPLQSRGARFAVGALHCFAGGSGLTVGATVAPFATLEDPQAGSGAELGATELLPGGWLPIDFDGDGVLDLLAARRHGLVGDVLVGWRGGAALAGSPAPWLQLRSPTPNDRFGRPLQVDAAPSSGIARLRVADLTGDGISDLLVPAPARALPGGASGAGALDLFVGGSGLGGWQVATVHVVDPTAPAGSALGSHPVTIADLDGDGVLDLAFAMPQWGDPASGAPSGAVAVVRGPLAGSLARPQLLVEPLLGQGAQLGR